MEGAGTLDPKQHGRRTGLKTEVEEEKKASGLNFVLGITAFLRGPSRPLW